MPSNALVSTVTVPLKSAAPAHSHGQKTLDALAVKLLAHDLFVPRAGPEREPLDLATPTRAASVTSPSGARPALDDMSVFTFERTNLRYEPAAPSPN